MDDLIEETIMILGGVPAVLHGVLEQLFTRRWLRSWIWCLRKLP